MSRRIGILTFHWADNYGGLLQCYALKNYLDKCGHNVSVINYWPEYALVKRATRLGTNSILKQFGKKIRPDKKQLLKNIILGRYLSAKETTKKMDRFRSKYITGSQEVYFDFAEIEEQVDQYDLLISGSDQIWNPNLTGNCFDRCYFLDFNNKEHNPVKCSYAASLGVSLKQEWEQSFKSLLSNYQFISTRESSLSDMIQKRFGIDACGVVDPVLLLSEEDWNKLVPEKQSDEHYILLYTLQRNATIVGVANWLSKKTNLPIHVIGAWRSYRRAKYFNTSSVEDFLSQFKNADYILTNSFHGTVFSIIFKKFFLTFLETQKPTRMIDLLKDIGLYHRIYQGDNREIVLENPEYENAYILLGKKIQESQDYLAASLSF